MTSVLTSFAPALLVFDSESKVESISTVFQNDSNTSNAGAKESIENSFNELRKDGKAIQKYLEDNCNEEL